MYAIIQTGGKQYRVAKGDVIDVELLKEENSKVSFNEVMLYHNGKIAEVGAPTVKGCVVQAEVLGEEKGPKVIAFKYKRRKSSSTKIGHRQRYTRVKITEIKKGKKEE